MRIRDIFEGEGDRFVDPKAVLSAPENNEEENKNFDQLKKTGFYGSAGSGCLVYAKDTRKFLLMLRSGSVEQPHTWGNCGGALAEKMAPDANAIKEVKEETGYSGPHELHPLLVFKKGSFRYYNYLMIVPHEFDPVLNWEATESAWVEWDDWPHPLHFGLKALFADRHSVMVIKSSAAN